MKFKNSFIGFTTACTLTLPVYAQPQKLSPVQLEVGSDHTGYKLHIEQKKYTLKPGLNEVETDGTREPIRLHTPSNRLLSTSVASITPSLLENESRFWLIALDIGSTSLGSQMTDIYYDQRLHTINVGAYYRAYDVGVEIIRGEAFNNVEHGAKVFTKYNRREYKLGVNYEIAPFYRMGAFFARLHLVPTAGVVYTEHEFEIKSGEVSLRDKDSTVSPYGAVVARMAIMVNIWATLRYEYKKEEIEFENLDFKKSVLLQTTTLGGGYAF